MLVLLTAFTLLPSTTGFADGDGSGCVGSLCGHSQKKYIYERNLGGWGNVRRSFAEGAGAGLGFVGNLPGLRQALQGFGWATGKMAAGYRELAKREMEGMGNLTLNEKLGLDVAEGLFIESVVGLAMEGLGPLVRGMRGAKSGAGKFFNALPSGQQVVPHSPNISGVLDDVDQFATTLPDMPAAKGVTGVKTPSWEVHFNPETNVHEIEFLAKEAHLSDPFIRQGGNMTRDTAIAIAPDGRLVIFEGKHRAVASAAGSEIPSALGGIPGKPGWLRYKQIHLSPEEWRRLLHGELEVTSIGKVIRNPEQVKAALSGGDPSNWRIIKIH